MGNQTLPERGLLLAKEKLMNLTQITDLELRKELRKRNQLRKKRSRKAHGLGPRKKGMGCRIGDRDEAEKVRRGWLEAGSYVRRDGSEKLVGKDLAKRQDEIKERSGGQCEEPVAIDIGEYERCHYTARHIHHKVKRSVRRDDRAKNLIHICEEHHDLKHPEFKTQWSKK